MYTSEYMIIQLSTFITLLLNENEKKKDTSNFEALTAAEKLKGYEWI